MLTLGVSYYPETFDTSEWERDLKCMKSAGLTVTRILDFAWPWVEPREGEYDFTHLDRYLDLCDTVGISVVLCTPTATPPAWLARKHPEIMVELRNGDRIPWGSRRHVCLNSSIYRSYCSGIAEKLGARYGHRATIRGWQIDNEVFGTEGYPMECHCPECQDGFRRWLQTRYPSIQSLNDAWGMMFWNHSLSDWAEVQTPRNRGSNLGHTIDYQEFFSDSLHDFVKVQYDVLKGVIDGAQWVTTNCTGTFNVGVDFRKYARSLDFGAWDAYPGSAGGPCRETFEALANELYRSAVHKPFAVLECSSSHMWPWWWAEMRARGADSIVWWHWRSIRWGAESGSDTLCYYNGTPKQDRLDKISRFKQRIDKVDAEMPKSLPKRQCAFLFSYMNVRSEMRHGAWPQSPYLASLPTTYRPFRQLGVPVDVVAPGESLEGYRLAIAPSLEYLDDADAHLLAEYVYNGGVLIARAPFARRDTHGKYHLTPAASVAELFGVHLLDVHAGGETRVTVVGQGDLAIDGQGEPLEATTARVLARFADGAYAGRPAITVNSFGKGTAFYMAGFSDALCLLVAKDALKAAGLWYVDNPNKNVAIVPHLTGKGTWYLNQGDTDATVNGVTIPALDWEFVAGR